MIIYILIIIIVLLFIKIVIEVCKMNKFAKAYKEEQPLENLKKHL